MQLCGIHPSIHSAGHKYISCLPHPDFLFFLLQRIHLRYHIRFRFVETNQDTTNSKEIYPQRNHETISPTTDFRIHTTGPTAYGMPTIYVIGTLRLCGCKTTTKYWTCGHNTSDNPRIENCGGPGPYYREKITMGYPVRCERCCPYEYSAYEEFVQEIRLNRREG